LNTRFLRSFCLVAEVGSLAVAARQLGLANASLSEQIRALEKELNASLITRRGQGVALTPAGQAVLDVARGIVAQAEAMRHLAQTGHPRGRLRVGSISTALMAIFPAALQDMAARYPAIELTVVPGTSTNLFRMLEAGEIDCALIVQPPFQCPKSLAWSALREEPLVLLAPADAPGDVLEDVLRSAPFIRMDRHAWTGQIVEAFLAERALNLREFLELDAPETIVMLVAQGMGVSLLHDWGIAQPAGGGVRLLPTGDARFARPVGILGRRGPVSALVDAFCEAVRSSMDRQARCASLP